MKINMGTVEMSDEQRKLLADVLDGKKSARKATRVEAKEFIWQHGDTWAETLTDMVNGDADAAPVEADEDDDEDLLGDITEDDIDEDDLL